MTEDLLQTDRTRLRRSHQRGSFDRAVVNAILDAQPMCSVGYVIDGKPYVTPTLQWREGDHVYWHASSASRALRAASGQEVCLNVAILDGYVMARSGFHHSVNSRSVMLFGTAHLVPDEEKQAKLSAFIDGLWPGRAAMLRPNSAQELKATSILALKIEEGSAKIRTGGPKDEEEDYALPIWAGVIPVTTQIGTPIDDARLTAGIAPPAHLTAMARKF
ncbi:MULTISPECIES: pyridoxamine 5'-phosphate oxidase family protein [unclassified Acidocella]|uniref:pyridoxamine 5'-phosphate oxidase family protein n=1 Tax=unclassified Acidocella TaxID=2648610 RepID=UPI00028BFE59|nr:MULTISPECIES: pyridoxamine 5'-phosphate oxidase family protein [unclassified Acidocella]EKM99958.1 flavin-nucleotide-binding protein [Acidocella sp. MX-AZ02]WBO59565.1 pyridoxamine 5'-phosphate oxidase family protein [Acidocella sp. MX-AZ03]